MKKLFNSVIIPLVVAILVSLLMGHLDTAHSPKPLEEDNNVGEVDDRALVDIPEDAYIANIGGDIAYSVEMVISSNQPLSVCDTEFPEGSLSHFDGVSVAGEPLHGRGRCISRNTMKVTLHSQDNDLAVESYDYMFASLQKER